jgi:hypothetical protein
MRAITLRYRTYWPRALSCAKPRQTSMSKMPHARHDHEDSLLVGGDDDHIQAITEWKKRVRCNGSAR